MLVAAMLLAASPRMAQAEALLRAFEASGQTPQAFVAGIAAGSGLHPVGNGEFVAQTGTVTFADGTSVTVDDDRGANNARCGKDKWPMIIEKAWKERYGDADLINGGSATEPFKGFGALGYKDVRMSWLQTDQAISDDELRKLLTSGRPMVASAEIGSVNQPPWDQTTGFDGGGKNGGTSGGSGGAA